MANGLLQRVTTLLLILAILVAPGAGVMSMTAAMPAMDMAAPPPDREDGCKGCGPAKMAIADCGAICMSLVAIVQPSAAFSAGVPLPPRQWQDESVGRFTAEPPTAPPRSQY